MNKLNLVAGVAVAFSLSSVASATNQILDSEVGVTAYIAAGLGLSAAPMDFGALVAPTRGTGPSSVQIACNGSVTYSEFGSPAGVSSNEEWLGATNANDTERSLPTVGSVTITGEKDYAVSVSVRPADEIAGVTLTPGLALASDCSVDLGGNYSLDDNGELTLNLFGTLEVAESTQSASGVISTNVLVSVDYR